MKISRPQMPKRPRWLTHKKRRKGSKKDDLADFIGDVVEGIFDVF